MSTYGPEPVSIFDAVPILAADEDLGLAVAWNFSATFNVYAVQADGRLVEVDVFTRYGDGPDGRLPADEAMGAARDYLQRVLDAAADDEDDER